MKLVTFKNTLPGVLDLAPLKDDLGRNLMFRGNESRDLPATLLEEALIKRVMASKWLVEVTTPLVASVASVKAAPIVIKTSAPPEELKLPVMVEEPTPLPAAPPAAPEAPTVSAAPAEPEPVKEQPPAAPSGSGKSKK